jgi:hypothetical protein
MQKLSIFIILACLQMVSVTARAACESQLVGFRVDHPTGGPGSGSVSFQLKTGYIQMSISVRPDDFNQPHFRAMYNLLQDASLRDIPVSFGVDLGICNILGQYQLNVNGYGSYSILPLHRVMNLRLGESYPNPIITSP